MAPIKESEHVRPAFEALREGNYRAAIDRLQLVAIEKPASTSDDPEAIRRLEEEFTISRMRTLWLMMIVQRLDDHFAEAGESRRLIGFYFYDPSIAKLASDEIYDILLVRAKEKNDDLTLQILLAAQPVHQD